MTILTLSKFWINRMDTGDAVSGYSDPDRSREHTIDGEVSTYAGGRQRAIHVKGERGTYSFTLKELTLADVETLREWIGALVQVRDHRGQRYVGTYFGVSIGEVRLSLVYEVSISLQMLSVVEGV